MYIIMFFELCMCVLEPPREEACMYTDASYSHSGGPQSVRELRQGFLSRLLFPRPSAAARPAAPSAASAVPAEVEPTGPAEIDSILSTCTVKAAGVTSTCTVSSVLPGNRPLLVVPPPPGVRRAMVVPPRRPQPPPPPRPTNVFQPLQGPCASHVVHVHDICLLVRRRQFTFIGQYIYIEHIVHDVCMPSS